MARGRGVDNDHDNGAMCNPHAALVLSFNRRIEARR